MINIRTFSYMGFEVNELDNGFIFQNLEGDEVFCKTKSEVYNIINESIDLECSRDYSPSNPWDAPGMSFSDFI